MTPSRQEMATKPSHTASARPAETHCMRAASSSLPLCATNADSIQKSIWLKKRNPTTSTDTSGAFTGNCPCASIGTRCLIAQPAQQKQSAPFFTEGSEKPWPHRRQFTTAMSAFEDRGVEVL